MADLIAICGDGVHDGLTLRRDAVLLVEDGICAGIVATDAIPDGARRLRVDALICPAFVDLQVNGGGGTMVDGGIDERGLRAIAAAHAGLGCGAILPTLVTDTTAATRAAISAVAACVAAGDTIVAGLHLEGPHLAASRKGAHDPALIRPMGAEDLAMLCDAARRLPALMVTLAPEAVTPQQIAALTRAGAIVSLGHSNTDYDTARAAFRAGARAVTHLFNAMSPLSHRAPGLVGAALDTPGVAVGVIADGVHVHPAALRVANAACPDGLFLVSDAMAVAGTEQDSFTLHGRRVIRADGRLALADGTLAGADLELARAVWMMARAGAGVERSIAMATGRPGRLLGGGAGRLVEGAAVKAIVLTSTADDTEFRAVPLLLSS